MRENCKAVLHAYDLWLVAKDFKKQENEPLCMWSKAINHLYHRVPYSDSQQQLEVKWLSMEHHIMDEVL